MRDPCGQPNPVEAFSAIVSRPFSQLPRMLVISTVKALGSANCCIGRNPHLARQFLFSPRGPLLCLAINPHLY